MDPFSQISDLIDPYQGGPTIENADLLSFLDIEREDSQGLEVPFIDPVNIMAGGLAGMASSGISSGLAQLPGMIASEVPIGLMLEQVDEYSDSPILNAVAGLALPMAAGRYFEPHVNSFSRKLVDDLAEAVSGSTFSQMGAILGPNAVNADLRQLAAAKDMYDMDVDEWDIWNNTGWYKSPDDMWRWEIPDEGLVIQPISELGGSYAKRLGRGQTVNIPLNEVLSHPLLQSEYPGLLDMDPATGKRMFAELTPDSGGGWYDGLNRMGLGTDGPFSADRYTAGHELQHMIQRAEGFARGGNPQMFYPSAELGWMAMDRDITPHEAYNRLAGEAEARMVEERLDYPPEQRKGMLPLDDYDVSRHKLIVRQ